jgi:WD40 repeat protein
MDNTIRIWDLNSGQYRQTCQGHEDGVVKIKWHPTEPLLFSCSTDRYVTFARDVLRQCALTRARVSRSRTIRLWDARSATAVRTWLGHQDMILDFDVSSDGKTVVSASEDSTVLVFAVDN